MKLVPDTWIAVAIGAVVVRVRHMVGMAQATWCGLHFSSLQRQIVFRLASYQNSDVSFEKAWAVAQSLG